MKKEYIVEIAFVVLFAIMVLASYQVINLGFDWLYLACIVLVLSIVVSIRKRGIFARGWIIALIWLVFILIRQFIPLP